MNPEQEILLTLNSGPTPKLNCVWNPLDFVVEFTTENENIFPIAELSTICEEAGKLLDKVSGLLEPIPTSSVVGMEVGDDRVDLCQNPLLLGCMLITQSEVFGMKTSMPDTYISKTDWNFCEVTSQIPCAPEGSLDYARKTSFSTLEYTDSPTLRIVIDVQKSDRSHSSTVVGKSSLLGNRVNTPRTSNRMKLELASWVQDGCLRTHHSPEPKYIHKFMGGSGCPPLYGEAVNTYLYLRGYKNGSYSRVYASAINEAKDCVYSLDSGKTKEPVLCSKLRQKQEYLHITYASNLVMPPDLQLYTIDRKDEPIKPLYKAAGSESFVQGMENRLLQSRKVVTYQAASVEIMRRNRILDAVFGVGRVKDFEIWEKEKSQNLRAEYNGALRANSAIQNLLNRRADGSEIQKLLGEGFLVTGSGQLDITIDDIRWLCEGGKGESFTIDDLSVPQDMYLRSEVTMEETLRIGGIPLATKFNQKSSKASFTRAEIGLWQMSAEKEEWAENTVQDLLKVREAIGRPLQYDDLIDVFYKHREWVSDDSLLIAKVIADSKGRPRSSILLLTADKRLARVMAQTTGLNVYLCPPEAVVHRLGRENVSTDNVTVESFKEKLEIASFSDSGLPEPMYLYIDQGSCDRAFMRMEANRDLHGNLTGSVNRKTFLDCGINSEGKRYTHLKLEKLQNAMSFVMEVISSNTETKRFLPTFTYRSERRDPGSMHRTPRLARLFRRGTKGA